MTAKDARWHREHGPKLERVEEEAVRLLPAEAVSPFIEKVRLHALLNRYLPMSREDKAEAKRLKRDLDSLERAIEIVADDPSVERRLRIKRDLVFMAWQRAARAKEANLSTRQKQHRRQLVDEICRHIAEVTGVRLGHLKLGARPSTASAASGVTPLITAALDAIGYNENVFDDLREFIAANRDEADADALRDADEMSEFGDDRQLADRPNFVAE